MRVVIYFEEVKEKSSHYGLYKLGFTCATRVDTKGCNSLSSSKTLKIINSSDCKLKLVYMKSESLVIVN